MYKCYAVVKWSAMVHGRLVKLYLKTFHMCASVKYHLNQIGVFFNMFGSTEYFFKLFVLNNVHNLMEKATKYFELDMKTAKRYISIKCHLNPIFSYIFE